MKKLLSLLLSLLLLLPLVSCGKITTPEQLESTRKSTGWAYTHLASGKDDTVLRVSFPMEWKLEKEQDSLLIKADEAVIGEVYEGAPRDAESVTLYETEAVAGVTVSVYYGRLTRGGEKAPYYQFYYQYADKSKKRSVTAEIKIDAMDAVAYKWLRSPRTAQSTEATPSLRLSAGNGKKAVLFLGNSFVGTSRVGTFFDAMVFAAKKDCTVTAKSIGYATAALYATQYTEWLTRIKQGDYGIVFMCGLYGSGDVSALQTLLDACKVSNTRLVIFPAHNESASQIKAAAEIYQDTPLLNWKNEIDKYIAAGVPLADLCIDDAHMHSTPLAGYIGAAMVYRAVFDTEPPSLPEGAPLSQSEVDGKLGNFQVGPTRLIPEKDIHRLP